MSANLDFINLMTYDFHGSSWEPTLADHHSPLRKRPGETTNLNSDYSVNYWISKGMPASKINMGVPLYGQSWALTSNTIVPPAHTSGDAPAGPFTGEAGTTLFTLLVGKSSRIPLKRLDLMPSHQLVPNIGWATTIRQWQPRRVTTHCRKDWAESWFGT